MMRESTPAMNRRPCIAIIATTPRTREYGRRALCLLGYAPLIFVDVNEFLEIGNRLHEISMVFLEHSLPDVEGVSESSDVGNRVRQAVGNDLPIVHSVMVQSGGAVPGFKGSDILLPGSLSFAQLCRTLRGFLQKHGVPVANALLERGAYRFCIDSGLIFVNGVPVTLKPDEFDLALELFFNAGTPISRLWLKTMIPGIQTLRRRPTAPAADAALLRVRDALSLHPKHGWELKLNPGVSCVLVKSNLPT